MELVRIRTIKFPNTHLIVNIFKSVLSIKDFHCWSWYKCCIMMLIQVILRTMWKKWKQGMINKWGSWNWNYTSRKICNQANNMHNKYEERLVNAAYLVYKNDVCDAVASFVVENILYHQKLIFSLILCSADD